MENIPPPSPLQNTQLNANDVLPVGAGALDANQRPTGNDVVKETERLREIKRLQKVGGNNWITDEEFANAISRKYKIVSKYADQGDASSMGECDLGAN